MNWLAALSILCAAAACMALAGSLAYLERRFAIPDWIWVAGFWVVVALLFGALV